FSIPRPPPTPTLFPYTTLFRSGPNEAAPLLDCPANVHRFVEAVAQANRANLPNRPRALQPPPSFPATIEVLLLSEGGAIPARVRSEEHTSELQSRSDLVCRLLL